ncbi:MAG: carboxylesterase [Planctomycetota bacterium]
MIPHLTVDHGPKAADPSAYSVIWMHGLGADGHDFEPIVPHLGLSASASVRFLFPHADVRPVTLNGGMSMRAWYDIVSISGPRNSDMKGVANSAEQIEELIAAEKARGVPAERIFVAGFSQGGAMALHVGLRHAEKLAGIMALSAYLLDETGLGKKETEANQSTPLLQCHGSWDPVVPLALGEQSKNRLETLGYAVDWRTYPMEHSVHEQEIQDIGAWFTQIMG